MFLIIIHVSFNLWYFFIMSLLQSSPELWLFCSSLFLSGKRSEKALSVLSTWNLYKMQLWSNNFLI